MSKYQFHRLGSDKFQEMVQSLLEVRRRGLGEFIQFGSAGADGAREATWTQPPNHPDYLRPANLTSDLPKKWVFQVKFHDIGLRGWTGAGAAVVSDLKAELEKVTNKYKLDCHHYVLLTNVPLTGSSRVGTRDKVSKIASDWKMKIPCVEVWDAADLSRMLDNNVGVRTSYQELILPGDILSSLHRQLQFQADRRESTFRGYLKNLIDHESKARAEEAGDDEPLPLSKVFIDQTLQLDKESIPECYRDDVDTWASGFYFDQEAPTVMPDDLDEVSSAFPLLWGAQQKVMLLAGPGYGKSTITQFLALYHAGRIIDPEYAALLAQRLKLPPKWTAEDLDASCTLRFPFRVELRRYAKWRKTLSDASTPPGIASYIASKLIGGVVESTLSQDDVFALISSNPSLLILDGLDEVPNKDDRDAILKDCDAFLNRCSGENVDLQIVMSSRPQGYHGEFDRFHPLRWLINDLSEDDFYRYSSDWLSERITNPEERGEAEERIKRGMDSDAVRRLATTLLQATVMLTIVKKKSDIPEERHKLFEKYVDVVFQREKTKNELIANYETELRLLHEMVGYQIHETVSRGEVGVMPEPKFKELVWRVWRLIRGDEKINTVPNQEIQSIYELSTDRLVFLSGKGSSQSDIDFVIQPYREYFAASFIANQDDTDPDKVFECLVERGPFWQQVLRFFAAMAMPAQRRAWASDASFTNGAESNSDEWLRGLRARRAVLFSLPEFGRLQFEQFRKTLIGCMPEHESWTWLGQNWLAPIIEGLRSGEAWRELWRVAKHTNAPIYGKREFSIWLFPKVIPKDAPEFLELLDFMSSAIADPSTAKSAIEAAIYYELPLDLALPSEEILFDVLYTFPYRRNFRRPGVISELVDRLPRDLAIRFLCTLQYRYSGMHEGEDIWAFMGIPVVEKPSVAIRTERSGEPIIAVVPPAWLGFSIKGQLPLDEMGCEGGAYAVYIGTLYESLRNPNDPEFYRKAARAMEELPMMPAWSLRCEGVLGPSPDQFSSSVDWQYYKSEMRLLFSTTEDISILYAVADSFRTEKDKGGNDWMLFLFPPYQWSHLISQSLVGAELVASLQASRWVKLAELNSEAMELVTFRRYLPLHSAAIDVPFINLMRIAVDLHNRGELVESNIVHEVFAFASIAELSADDFHSLIGEIRNSSEFPASWAAAIVETCLRVNGVNSKLLANFWAATNSGGAKSIWLRLRHHDTNWERIHEFIGELMKLPNGDGLDLAIRVVSQCPECPKIMMQQLNHQATSGLQDLNLDARQRSLLVRCLFHSESTLAEAKLYSNVQVVNAIIGSQPFSGDQIVTRIVAMPQTLSKEEFSSLKIELEKLLAQKGQYAPEICAAAVDALIQLDIANCAPITEAHWRASQ